MCQVRLIHEAVLRVGLQVPCEPRTCCCATFCTLWVFVLTVALSALWYYYLQEPNATLRYAVNDLNHRLTTGLAVRRSRAFHA